MTNTGARTEAGKMVVSQSLDPVAWTNNPQAVAAIDMARRLRTTKHGLYASVPIICKAESCPYKEACPLIAVDMAPYGEKCPMEIAAIEDLFDRYCVDLKINRDDPRSTIDLLMVKDVVDADIALLRCDNKMAIDADFIIENVVGMTEEGEAMTRKELHPVVEYKEKLRAGKNKTLQLLNSTRRDKQGTKVTVELDPSQRAAQMMGVKSDMDAHLDSEKDAEQAYYERMRKPGTIIDVDPSDLIGVDGDE